MTGAVLGWVAGLLLASPAAPAASAQASPPWYQPGRSRVVAGVIGGAVLGNPSTSTARGESEGGNPLSVGFLLEYERRFFQYFSIAVGGSFSGWQGTRAKVGYRNQRLDLGVAPHLEVLRVTRPGAWLGELYLAVPVGLSDPFVSVPERRAFTERIDSRLGWYAGGAIGVTVLFRRWGFRIESCYCRHQYGSRTTITPNDPTQVILIDETTLVDDQLLFTFAGVFAF